MIHEKTSVAGGSWFSYGEFLDEIVSKAKCLKPISRIGFRVVWKGETMIYEESIDRSKIKGGSFISPLPFMEWRFTDKKIGGHGINRIGFRVVSPKRSPKLSGGSWYYRV